MQPSKKQKELEEKLPRRVQESLNLAHAQENQDIPDDQDIEREHKILSDDEKEIQELLTPEPLANVKDLGKWKEGDEDIDPIPRIKTKK